MFTLSEREEFSWPVAVPRPRDGKVIHEEFTAVFERLPEDELKALLQQGDRAFLDRVLVGWSEVRDHNGVDVPFSTGKPLLLGDPGARGAAIMAYWQALAGQEYKRKNSAASDADG